MVPTRKLALACLAAICACGRFPPGQAAVARPERTPVHWSRIDRIEGVADLLTRPYRVAPGRYPVALSWGSADSLATGLGFSDTASVLIDIPGVGTFDGGSYGSCGLTIPKPYAVRVRANCPWRVDVYRLSSSDLASAPTVPKAYPDATSVARWTAYHHQKPG